MVSTRRREWGVKGKIREEEIEKQKDSKVRNRDKEEGYMFNSPILFVIFPLVFCVPARQSAAGAAAAAAVSQLEYLYQGERTRNWVFSGGVEEMNSLL